jgi:hypothetical protein
MCIIDENNTKENIAVRTNFVRTVFYTTSCLLLILIVISATLAAVMAKDKDKDKDKGIFSVEDKKTAHDYYDYFIKLSENLENYENYKGFTFFIYETVDFGKKKIKHTLTKSDIESISKLHELEYSVRLSLPLPNAFAGTDPILYMLQIKTTDSSFCIYATQSSFVTVDTPGTNRMHCYDSRLLADLFAKYYKEATNTDMPIEHYNALAGKVHCGEHLVQKTEQRENVQK